MVFEGVRQIGLGHFLESYLLDIRTDVPKIGGVSAFGREVILRCNQLGVVIDLAHATDQAVAQALEVSQQPMLWSHSAITRQMTDWRSRNSHIMRSAWPTPKYSLSEGLDRHVA